MENLRLTFLIFGIVAIVAVLVHGLWTIRKNSKSSDKPKLEPTGWENNSTKSEEASDGFDDVGVGPVRVISTNEEPHDNDFNAKTSFDNPLSVNEDSAEFDEAVAESTVLSPSDPLINSEELSTESLDGADAEQSLPESAHAFDKAPQLDDDLSINNTEMSFEQLAAQHEEEPQKLYGSVVTQPKPEFTSKSRSSESSQRNQQIASGDDIPEPPPFLLKSEAATPKTNPDVNTVSQTATNSPSDNAIDQTRPRVDAHGRVEPEFKLDAEPLEQVEEEKPIGLAAQARKLVTRRKKSVADKIRKDPPVMSSAKANEEQMRIDFNQADNAQQVNSTTDQTSSSGGQSNSNQQSSSATSTAQTNDEQPTDVLVLNVRAPADREIPGAALLPMLLTLGFKFGEQDIFHRHVNTNGKGPVLFSLANLFKPGVFDIDNIENFSTRGLSLFMMLPIEGEAQQVFNMMHNAARKLADEFGCQILDGSRGVLTKQGLQKYSERIREFERKRINR